MNPFRSALALVKSLATTSATGVFVPPIGGSKNPYDNTDMVNTLIAADLYRGGYTVGGPSGLPTGQVFDVNQSYPGLAYGELPNTNPGGWQ